MNTLKQKLMGIHFKICLKRWCIITITVLLASAAVGSILWRSDTAGGTAKPAEATVQSTAGTDGEDAQDEQTREHEHEDGAHTDAEWFDLVQPLPLLARIALGILFAAGVLLGAGLWLLVAAWLYQAAENAGMNGVLWSVLGLIGFVVTAIAFVLVRSFRPLCPACGKRQSSAAFCRFCGASMTAKCRDCGQIISGGSAFCPHCGKGQKGE